MLHNKRVLLLLLCICIAGFTNPTDAGCHPAVVHGDILDVHPQAGKVRVLTGHGMLILELDAGCRIMRGLQEISCTALRPVYPGWYQDGLFMLNSEGRVVEILANYSIREQAGFLVSYDIFGEIKMMEPLP
ncbi:MAG: hypothetical protein ACOYEU_02970 [Limnochordia bacterium]|jgi:hypothetical protein